MTINGVAGYGTSELMSTLAPRDQTVRVGGQTRRVYFGAGNRSDMKPVSLRTATTTLRAASAELARAAEKPRRGTDPPVWSLALDATRDTGVDLCPRLPWSGPRDFTGPERVPRRAAAVPVPHAELLEPIKLDALRMVDDADFKTQIEAQPKTPDPILKLRVFETLALP